MSEESRRPRRLVRWLLVAIAGAALFYLIAGNLILNTNLLLPTINKKPEKTLVEWSGGRTLFPGRIHIEDLRIRGQSKGQQWEIKVDEADVRLSLLGLAGKAIRIGRARGTGLDFRMRPRLTAETLDDPDAINFPEIEGLSNPPDPAPEDIYPPKSPEKMAKPGWHLDFSNVEFEGPTMVWVGGARMSGDGLVATDMDFLLRREYHLSRAVFQLSDGEIAVGPQPFVGDLDINLDMTLGPFNPQEVKGLAVLDHLLGSSRLENGEIKDLRVLNTYIPGAGSLEVIGGSVAFHWSLDKPSAEEGSSGVIAMAAEGADLRIAGREVSGDLDLHSNLVRGSLREGSWELAETRLALDNMILDVLKEGEIHRQDQVDPADLWWGHFVIHSGRLNLGQPAELAAEASFAIKNTKPLMKIFLAKPNEEGDAAKVPKWVKLVPDIDDLGGTASLSVDESGSVLDDVVVQGDKFTLLARISSDGPESDGILYMRYRGIDFALDMRDGKSDVKILRPKRWFLSRLGDDDAAMREAIENPQR